MDDEHRLRFNTALAERPVMVIVDSLVLAQKALAGGAAVLQLRAKPLGKPELYELAEAIAKLCDDERAFLVVNDHLGIALAARAAGVHVGQQDLPVAAVRAAAGTRFVVGASARSGDQALAAAEAGADYVGVGAVFPSPTKPHLDVAGVGVLREVRGALDANGFGKLPVVAIGGIGAATAGECIAAGAGAIAVSHAIGASADPEATTRELVAICRQARQFPG